VTILSFNRPDCSGVIQGVIFIYSRITMKQFVLDIQFGHRNHYHVSSILLVNIGR